MLIRLNSENWLLKVIGSLWGWSKDSSFFILFYQREVKIILNFTIITWLCSEETRIIFFLRRCCSSKSLLSWSQRLFHWNTCERRCIVVTCRFRFFPKNVSEFIGLLIPRDPFLLFILCFNFESSQSLLVFIILALLHPAENHDRCSHAEYD